MPRVSNITTLQATSNNGCRCDCATPASGRRETRAFPPPPCPLSGGDRCKRSEELLRSCFVLSSPIWEQAATGRRPPRHVQRSEERRVGKECRSRWSPY